MCTLWTSTCIIFYCGKYTAWIATVTVLRCVKKRAGRLKNWTEWRRRRERVVTRKSVLMSKQKENQGYNKVLRSARTQRGHSVHTPKGAEWQLGVFDARKPWARQVVFGPTMPSLLWHLYPLCVGVCVSLWLCLLFSFIKVIYWYYLWPCDPIG